MIDFGDRESSKKALDGEGSKKERVVRLAQADPFLSVEEIARLVGTTSRYVRTTLSEAGITLTDLRRRFADDMRRRLAAAKPRDEYFPASTNAAAQPEHGRSREETGYIRVAQLVDAETAALLGQQPDAPLLEVCRVRFVNGQPLYVNQLVTTERLAVSEKLLLEEGPLHALLERVSSGAVQPVTERRMVDIVPAGPFFAELLRVQPGHPLLRSGTVVAVAPGSAPLAVEFNYFDAMRVRLELESAPRRALRVVERDGGVQPVVP